MAIHLNDEQEAIALDLDFWRSQAEKTATLLGVPPESEWSLTYVDEDAIRTLNRDYRAVDAPTDVLSFGQEEDEGFALPEGVSLLGDVVIATPVARRQAEARGHAVDAELALLMVHGLLHLLGHDHAEPEEKAAMWAEQARVLAALGFTVEDTGDAL